MSKIVLGVTSDGKPFAIDLVLLLETRLLLSANSGGGKSYTLRQLIEQIFGKVQIILVDREGEFKSLRDKYDFLLVGEGGDIPAHIGSARLLAEKLLESGVSAICDLYEAFRTRPIDRLAWVREFLMGLVDAPKHLWHDVVVIVDEAHIFCPEVAPKGQDMKERAIINGCKDAVVALCTVGRKRGLAAVLATQRLAKLDKDASAELLNRMIGMTMEGQDVERAIDLMSIPREEKASFKKSIRELEPGDLYAFGRAISKERIQVKINKVQTKHHDPRSRKHVDYSPPTPAKIRALLSKFEDLPKEIEAKAKTEADLKKENQALSVQVQLLSRKLTAVTNQTAIVSLPLKPTIQTKTVVETKVQKVKVPILKPSEVAQLMAVARKIRRISKDLAPLEGLSQKFHGKAAALSEKLDTFGKASAAFEARKPSAQPTVPPDLFGKSVLPPTLNKGKPEFKARIGKTIENYPKAAPTATPEDGPLSNLQLRQLQGMEDFRSIGINKVDRKILAAWLGLSMSGHFQNSFRNLHSRSLLAYEGNAFVLTAEGIAFAPTSKLAPTTPAILDRCCQALDSLRARQLRHLHEIHPQYISRDDLAAALGLTVSGHFQNSFRSLHAAGMIDYGQKGTAEAGMLKCASWFFILDGVPV